MGYRKQDDGVQQMEELVLKVQAPCVDGVVELSNDDRLDGTDEGLIEFSARHDEL